MNIDAVVDAKLICQRVASRFAASARTEAEQIRGLVLMAINDDWSRAFRLYEDYLVLCMKCRMLHTSAHFLSALEILYPGYATSVHGPSRAWPWQRRLWSGLIEEDKGNYKKAVEEYGQALELSTDIPLGMNFEQEREMYNIADLDPVTTSIARCLINIHLGEVEVTGEDTPNPQMFFDVQIAVRSVRNGLLTSRQTAIAVAITVIDFRKAQHILEILRLQDVHVQETQLTEHFDLQTLKSYLVKYHFFNTKKKLQSIEGKDEIEERELKPLETDSASIESYDEQCDKVFALMRDWSQSPDLFSAVIETLPEHVIIIYLATSVDGTALISFWKRAILHASSIKDLSNARISVLVRKYVSLISRLQGSACTKELSRLADSISSHLRPAGHSGSLRTFW